MDNMTDYTQPETGTFWHGQGFEIQVIGINDAENIKADGSYKRSGQVIYKYISQPVGKIGNCKTLKGFYASWNLSNKS